MTHKHSVYDSDTHFSINPLTRVIKNESSMKTTVIQYDHNSERFTFELARSVEGHDMSKCDRVEVHFLNGTNAGVYVVDDFQVSPDSADVVICSWLIASTATQFTGNLNFLLRFACTDDDGSIGYAWHTSVFNGITVSNGMNNDGAVVEEYPDIFAEWERRITALENGGSGGSGTPGADCEDGGYYTPSVSQVDSDTVRFSFMASKSGMPTVPSTDIDLPVGNSGSGGTTTENVTLPAYWENHLTNKIATIKAKQDEVGKDCFSFAVITDIHYAHRLATYSGAILKRIADDCDIKYVLCLGDVVTRATTGTLAQMETEFAAVRSMLSPVADKLLQTQGNHDGSYGYVDKDGNGAYNTGDTSYAFNYPPEKIHNRIYRSVGVVGDAHFDESGTGYYIDDTANKVRYIILNTHNNEYAENADGSAVNSNMIRFRYGQSQFDLVIEALESIPKDSWSVILASHVPPVNNADKDLDGIVDSNESFATNDRTAMLGVLNAYKNKTTYTGTYGTSGNYDYISVNVDFSQAKGNILGYFAGHVHVDLHWDGDEYGIPVFSTRCDGNVGGGEPTRTAGNATEHSFDIFTVNKKTGGVYATKIGAGYDRNIGWNDDGVPDEPVITTHTITNKLTNCTNSNSASTITEGSPYSATITANSGYVLDSVTVTMGGNTVTVTNGIINIASVTGNIVITATAIKENTGGDTSSYTNIIDTVGYVDDVRLSSSDGAGERDAEGYVTTGVIDIPAGGTLRTRGANFNHTTYSQTNIYVYNASTGAYITVYSPNTGASGYTTSLDSDGNLTLVCAGAAKVRLCGYGTGANLIVTINESIT